MKKLLSVFVFCCFLVLLLFLLLGGAEEQITALLASKENMKSYWIASFTILSADIFIPVPSSLVMILNGKVLGFFSGTLLSTTSGVLSSCIGFYLGRKSGSFINKFFSAKEQQVSTNIFCHYGKFSIPVSKALPIVSEAISFLSGTTGIPFRTFFWYSLFGHFIISTVYAYAGSFTSEIDSNLLSGAIILFVLLIFWGISKILNLKSLQNK